MTDDDKRSKWAARGCERVLRHLVTRALYTDKGDPAIGAALDSLGTALQLQAIDGPPGSREIARIALDAPPRKALASLLAGDFRPDDLVLSTNLLSELAVELAGLEASRGGGDHPSGAGDQAGRPDGDRGGDRDDDRRDEKLLDYELWLLVTKIDCERETPGPGDDHLLLEGRAHYVTPGPDIDRPLDGTGGTFSDDGPPDTAVYKLFEVRVPQGHSTFSAFITPLESDGLSPAAARAIGYAVGGLLTAGVNAAYSALVAAAPSAGLTAADAAKDLISSFTLPWLVGLIARWFGPEPFTIVEVNATTDRTGGVVIWGGTVSSGNEARTLSAVGAGTLTYASMTIQQQEAAQTDGGAYFLRYVRDGGLYSLDVALQLVPMT